jgi:hypothetical protein
VKKSRTLFERKPKYCATSGLPLVTLASFTDLFTGSVDNRADHFASLWVVLMAFGINTAGIMRMVVVNPALAPKLAAFVVRAGGFSTQLQGYVVECRPILMLFLIP